MVHGDGGSRRRMSCIILQTQSEAGLFTVCSLSRPESRSAKQDLRKVRGESGRVPEVMIEYIARKYNHPMCSQCSCICACCPSIPASLCHVTTWISDSDSNTPSMMQTPSDRCGWWLQIACIMYRRDKMAAAWTTHPSSIVQHTACPLDQTLYTTCMKSCPIWFFLWYKELLFVIYWLFYISINEYSCLWSILGADFDRTIRPFWICIRLKTANSDIGYHSRCTRLEDSGTRTIHSNSFSNWLNKSQTKGEELHKLTGFRH